MWYNLAMPVTQAPSSLTRARSSLKAARDRAARECCELYRQGVPIEALALRYAGKARSQSTVYRMLQRGEALGEIVIYRKRKDKANARTRGEGA